MFQKAIEAVIEDGKKSLQAMADSVERLSAEAKKEIDRRSVEIEGLVTLAKDVPEKVFDRYSNVMVSVVEVVYPEAHYTKEIRIGGAQAQLQGIMGDEDLKIGKYRVIVLLEPLS